MLKRYLQNCGRNMNRCSWLCWLWRFPSCLVAKLWDKLNGGGDRILHVCYLCC